MIHFHLDEHVDPTVADLLRSGGIDVTTTQDERLLSASDGRQLEFALDANRVFVTRDSDFLRLHARGVQHSGIVYLCSRRSVGEIAAHLQLIAACLSIDEMRGKVEFF